MGFFNSAGRSATPPPRSTAVKGVEKPPGIILNVVPKHDESPKKNTEKDSKGRGGRSASASRPPRISVQRAVPRTTMATLAGHTIVVSNNCGSQREEKNTATTYGDNKLLLTKYIFFVFIKLVERCETQSS